MIFNHDDRISALNDYSAKAKIYNNNEIQHSYAQIHACTAITVQNLNWRALQFLGAAYENGRMSFLC